MPAFSAARTASLALAVCLYADGYSGQARIVIDLDHSYLLGVSFVGPGVSELLHSATTRWLVRSPWTASFPMISEVWLRLLEAYRG